MRSDATTLGRRRLNLLVFVVATLLLAAIEAKTGFFTAAPGDEAHPATSPPP